MADLPQLRAADRDRDCAASEPRSRERGRHFRRRVLR
jgi:hypothetical protein